MYITVSTNTPERMLSTIKRVKLYYLRNTMSEIRAKI